MYYIVRVYVNGTYDREFWTLDAAADFMAGLDAYCELVSLAGWPRGIHGQQQGALRRPIKQMLAWAEKTASYGTQNRASWG